MQLGLRDSDGSIFLISKVHRINVIRASNHQLKSSGKTVADSFKIALSVILLSFARACWHRISWCTALYYWNRVEYRHAIYQEWLFKFEKFFFTNLFLSHVSRGWELFQVIRWRTQIIFSLNFREVFSTLDKISSTFSPLIFIAVENFDSCALSLSASMTSSKLILRVFTGVLKTENWLILEWKCYNHRSCHCFISSVSQPVPQLFCSITTPLLWCGWDLPTSNRSKRPL